MTEDGKQKPLRLAVFASGGGSNFGAILNAIQAHILNAEITCVISNNRSAGALQRARDAGITAYHINMQQFDSPKAYDTAMLNILQEHTVELIILAGYMKKISDALINTFPNRIMNIHPSLLPHFGGKGMYGIHVHEAVINAGVAQTGVTIHFVNNDYDSGPIIIQETVPVHENDTPQSLQQRVLITEHSLYTKAIQLYADGRLTVSGNQVTIQAT